MICGEISLSPASQREKRAFSPVFPVCQCGDQKRHITGKALQVPQELRDHFLWLTGEKELCGLPVLFFP